MFGISMNAAACFADTYAQARQAFLDSSKAAGGRMDGHALAESGPNGEVLATDTASFGNPDARRVLVLVSGTHGVEGFCGSAAMMDMLGHGGVAALPEGVAVLMVHALNPFGYAWLRRATEEGIDLNRNVIDFTRPLPENPGYVELADAFVPRDMSPATLAQAEGRCAAYRSAHGEVAFETARSCGQHTHPEGIFYGGRAPARAMGTLAAICTRASLASRDAVAVIDYHTGLGPYGHGEPICGHLPGTSGQARCRSWYGRSLGEPLLGTSFSLPIQGLSQNAWARAVGDDRLTFVALEYGTLDRDTGARALQAEHWLHAHAGLAWHDPRSRRIKEALRDFYDPRTLAWREAVLLRSRHVIAQALRGLGALGPDGRPPAEQE